MTENQIQQQTASNQCASFILAKYMNDYGEQQQPHQSINTIEAGSAYDRSPIRTQVRSNSNCNTPIIRRQKKLEFIQQDLNQSNIYGNNQQQQQQFNQAAAHQQQQQFLQHQLLQMTNATGKLDPASAAMFLQNQLQQQQQYQLNTISQSSQAPLQSMNLNNNSLAPTIDARASYLSQQQQYGKENQVLHHHHQQNNLTQQQQIQLLAAQILKQQNANQFVQQQQQIAQNQNTQINQIMDPVTLSQQIHHQHHQHQNFIQQSQQQPKSLHQQAQMQYMTQMSNNHQFNQLNNQTRDKSPSNNNFGRYHHQPQNSHSSNPDQQLHQQRKSSNQRLPPPAPLQAQQKQRPATQQQPVSPNIRSNIKKKQQQFNHDTSYISKIDDDLSNNDQDTSGSGGGISWISQQNQPATPKLTKRKKEQVDPQQQKQVPQTTDKKNVQNQQCKEKIMQIEPKSQAEQQIMNTIQSPKNVIKPLAEQIGINTHDDITPNKIVNASEQEVLVAKQQTFEQMVESQLQKQQKTPLKEVTPSKAAPPRKQSFLKRGTKQKYDPLKAMQANKGNSGKKKYRYYCDNFKQKETVPKASQKDEKEDFNNQEFQAPNNSQNQQHHARSKSANRLVANSKNTPSSYQKAEITENSNSKSQNQIKNSIQKIKIVNDIKPSDMVIQGAINSEPVVSAKQEAQIAPKISSSTTTNNNNNGGEMDSMTEFEMLEKQCQQSKQILKMSSARLLEQEDHHHQNNNNSGGSELVIQSTESLISQKQKQRDEQNRKRIEDLVNEQEQQVAKLKQENERVNQLQQECEQQLERLNKESEQFENMKAQHVKQMQAEKQKLARDNEKLNYKKEQFEKQQEEIEKENIEKDQKIRQLQDQNNQLKSQITDLLEQLNKNTYQQKQMQNQSVQVSIQQSTVVELQKPEVYQIENSDKQQELLHCSASVNYFQESEDGEGEEICELASHNNNNNQNDYQSSRQNNQLEMTSSFQVDEFQLQPDNATQAEDAINQNSRTQKDNNQINLQSTIKSLSFNQNQSSCNNQTIEEDQREQDQSSSNNNNSSHNDDNSEQQLDDSSLLLDLGNNSPNHQEQADNENYDLVLPPEYHQVRPEPRVVEEVLGHDGKVQRIFENGKKQVVFSNGVTREVWPDGYSLVHFANKDIKQTFKSGKVVYYFSEAFTTQTTFPDGLQVFKFSNNQIEKHFKDGSKEINFPDGTIKVIMQNGEEESVFPDGTVQKIDTEGQRTIQFPNGQIEFHYLDGSRIRQYPDGTKKKLKVIEK